MLTFAPIDAQRWRLEPAFAEVDVVLNSIWGRRPDEPIYIYRVPDAKAFIGFENPADGEIETSVTEPGRIIFNATASRPLEEGAVIIKRVVASQWEETPDYGRLQTPDPLTFVDRTVEATSAGQAVGGYHLQYIAGWRQVPFGWLVFVATMAAFGWIVFLVYQQFGVTRLAVTRLAETPPRSQGDAC